MYPTAELERESLRVKVPDIKASVFIKCSPELAFDSFATEEKLIQWFVTEAKIGSSVGEEIRFSWKNWGVDQLNISDGGTVLAFDRPQRFGFSWKPGKNRTSVDIRIAQRDTGVLISLRETGFTLDEEDLEALMDCSVGWGEALTHLKFQIESGHLH